MIEIGCSDKELEVWLKELHVEPTSVECSMNHQDIEPAKWYEEANTE